MTSLKTVIRTRYQQAALAARAPAAQGCGTSACRPAYSAEELRTLPSESVAASMGCGNPTMLAELKPGEIVLDLGCGGGIDVLLAAKRVGPTGKAYGVDMTDEMLALARDNTREAGIENAESLKGEMEAIPLPDRSVDVVISNCVFNLSTDKDRVFAEAFRVLRPGGRLAVSDILVRGALPEEIRASPEAWAACVAGAIEESDYRARLERAGFVEIVIDAKGGEAGANSTFSADIQAHKPPDGPPSGPADP